MFTGLIQEVGRIKQITDQGGGRRIAIAAPGLSHELDVSQSVAVDGVCQTVVERSGELFTVEAVEETLQKTTLGELKESDEVNLELPIRLSDRIGGHLVQGHIDGVGAVKTVKKLSNSWLITVQIPKEFTRYVIPVGSIAIDGVSLTVASMHGYEIVVSIIPHTMRQTTFGRLKAGSHVNLEFDVLGKYVERLMRSGEGEEQDTESEGVTMEKLRTWGYES
jgi:riboflavin synthase